MKCCEVFVVLLLCSLAIQSQAGVTLKGGKLSTSDSKTEAELSGAATSIGWKEFIPRKGKPDFDGNKIVGCGGSKKVTKFFLVELLKILFAKLKKALHKD